MSATLLCLVAGALERMPTPTSYIATYSFERKWRDILTRPESLCVITDFDLTLTTGGSQECHDILGKSPVMPAAVRREFAPLLDFSTPFEPPLDGSGWLDKANQILVASGTPRRADLPPLVRKAPTRLRPGANELLELLAALGVPVLVVSAGCTDVITEFLEAHGALFPNMCVSSNKMLWDEVSGDLCRIAPEQPITSFNKGLTYARNEAFFERHRQRRNLLVLGDRTSDLQACATSRIIPLPTPRP